MVIIIPLHICGSDKHLGFTECTNGEGTSALYLSIDTLKTHSKNNDKGTNIGWSVMAQLITNQERDMKGHDPIRNCTRGDNCEKQIPKNNFWVIFTSVFRDHKYHKVNNCRCDSVTEI